MKIEDVILQGSSYLGRVLGTEMDLQTVRILQASKDAPKLNVGKKVLIPNKGGYVFLVTINGIPVERIVFDEQEILAIVNERKK